MPAIFQKKGMIAAAVTACLLLLTVILAICNAFAYAIFLVATAIALLVTLCRLDDDMLHWVKLCWPALPVLELITRIISNAQMRDYYRYYSYGGMEDMLGGMLGGLFSGYTAIGKLASVFAMLGLVTFIVLVCIRKCWKTRWVLLTSVGLVVLALLCSLLRMNSLNSVNSSYLVFLMLYDAIIGWVYICNKFRFAAAEKGYEGRCYFWITFLCGIVGMLLVIALPDKRVSAALERMSPPPVVEKPAPASKADPWAAVNKTMGKVKDQVSAFQAQQAQARQAQQMQQTAPMQPVYQQPEQPMQQPVTMQPEYQQPMQQPAGYPETGRRHRAYENTDTNDFNGDFN